MTTLSSTLDLSGFYGGYWNDVINITINYTYANDVITVNSISSTLTTHAQTLSGGGFFNSIYLSPTNTQQLPGETATSLPEDESIGNQLDSTVQLNTLNAAQSYISDDAGRFATKTNAISKTPYDVTKSADGKFHLLYGIVANRDTAGTGNRRWFYTADFNIDIPFYVPMAMRKSGTWQSLDPAGKINIRKSGSWQDISQENFGTVGQEGTGNNHIRKSGKWLQQSKA
jgi:hypothetical protein